MNREEAVRLLDSYVSNTFLRHHMLAVESAMRSYARHFEADEEAWALAGLLHDADYEKHPNEHPAIIVADLSKRGVDDEILQAIRSHGAQFGIERTTPMAKALFAVDELTGLIYATALLRPTKLEGLTSKSVVKKLKDKRFAAGVNRDDVALGIEELGVDRDEHITRIIEAMQEISHELELSV